MMPDRPQQHMLLPTAVLVAGAMIAASILMAGHRMGEAAERRVNECLEFYEEQLYSGGLWNKSTEKELAELRINARVGALMKCVG